MEKTSDAKLNLKHSSIEMDESAGLDSRQHRFLGRVLFKLIIMAASDFDPHLFDFFVVFLVLYPAL